MREMPSIEGNGRRDTRPHVSSPVARWTESSYRSDSGGVFQPPFTSDVHDRGVGTSRTPPFLLRRPAPSAPPPPTPPLPTPPRAGGSAARHGAPAPAGTVAALGGRGRPSSSAAAAVTVTATAPLAAAAAAAPAAPAGTRRLLSSWPVAHRPRPGRRRPSVVKGGRGSGAFRRGGTGRPPSRTLRQAIHAVGGWRGALPSAAASPWCGGAPGAGRRSHLVGYPRVVGDVRLAAPPPYRAVPGRWQ